jgi:MFS family permease
MSDAAKVMSSPASAGEPANEQSENPSLRAAIRDGIGYATMMGAGDAYIVPFGVFLKASLPQIGLLSSLPPLLGALSQAFGVWFMQHYSSRRRAITYGVALNAFIWILLAIVPFALGAGPSAVTALIVLVILYQCSNGFTAPIWSSLIGELVPADIRGRYFAKRNMYVSIFTLLSLLLAGQILGWTERLDIAAWGFLAIFLVAAAARAVSAYWLTKYDDPFFSIPPETKFSFYQFLRRAPYSNFAKFVLFGGLINFGVMFASPYFSVFMLRELNFSYFEYTVMLAAATVTQFLTIRFWGALSDRIGNKRILEVCAVGLCFSPIWWIFSQDYTYLIFVQIYSGFVWAGYNLANANFIFDAVSKAKLARCAAYQAIIIAFSTLCGSLLGGYTASHIQTNIDFFGLHWNPSSPYLIIFLLSGILRMIAVFTLLPRFHEVRNIAILKRKRLFFELVDLKPLMGSTFHVFTGGLRRKSKRGELQD